MSRTIDGSGFVIKVFDKIFPNSDSDVLVHNVAALRVTNLCTKVGLPQRGDIVYRNGHIGIVIDSVLEKCVGASPSSTGVIIASDTSGYGALQPNRIFR